ncbi:U32 family peptidase [Mycoplasmatota bacterium WC30]
MKLVARLKTIKELDKLDQLGIDVFCLDTEFTTKKISQFTISEIKEIVDFTESKHKATYVLINKMIHESDIESLNSFLKSIKDVKASGIVINDLSVYVIAKKYGLENKIIYQPGTMNTDSFSAEYFNDRMIKGITISREITLDEVNVIIKKPLNIEFSIIGHGYLDMFYSKRKLLTNYLTHKNISGKKLLGNYKLRLNEEIRPNDMYPVFEDEFGTHIFRSKKLISYEVLEHLSGNISDFFIERIFLDDEEFYDSIKLYRNKITIEDFLLKYRDYNSGFYFQRTEKVKGELNES